MKRSLIVGLSRPLRIAVHVSWALVLAAFGIYVMHLVVGFGSGPGPTPLLDSWLYSFIGVGGALMILVRAALVREERAAWALVGLAVLSWASADVVWWRMFSGADEIPYPSPADGLYILFFPLLYAGLILLLRARAASIRACGSTGSPRRWWWPRSAGRCCCRRSSAPTTARPRWPSPRTSPIPWAICWSSVSPSPSPP